MIFNKKENNSPSWSIKTELITKECYSTLKTRDEIHITAVDTYTGFHICSLISFREGLSNICFKKAKELLEEYGYDPYQYKTEFGPLGELRFQATVCM